MNETPLDQETLSIFVNADEEPEWGSRDGSGYLLAMERAEKACAMLSDALGVSLELEWVQDASFFAQIRTVERQNSRPILALRFSNFGRLVCSIAEVTGEEWERRSHVLLRQQGFLPVTLEQAAAPYPSAAGAPAFRSWFHRFFEWQ